MIRCPVRVVKVGGSLFSLDDLCERIRRSLDERSASRRGHTVLLAGGGPLVEVVRRADRKHGLGEKKSHWLSIRAMRCTARRLAEQLSEADYLESYFELLKRTQREGLTVFDSSRFLREIEPALPGVPLPESWDVTSDSIAARLAVALGAKLVLLKSKSPDSSAHASSREPLVDAFFSRISCEVRSVQIVNLRDG